MKKDTDKQKLKSSDKVNENNKLKELEVLVENAKDRTVPSNYTKDKEKFRGK